MNVLWFDGFYMVFTTPIGTGFSKIPCDLSRRTMSFAELRSRFFFTAIVDGACGRGGGFWGRFCFIFRWIFGFLIGGVKLIIGDNLEHSGTDVQ